MGASYAMNLGFKIWILPGSGVLRGGRWRGVEWAGRNTQRNASLYFF